ncbi:MAG: 1-acyl-sn-glycerol-3-phosphate acyltransferase [Actinomycetota bacterium]|nr:1-acyl-sn-glycerol-3-phosphate acyltransferase [Actinomycetota bacterium]
MRPQVYRDERPPEHFARFHARTRTRAPDAVYQVVRLISVVVGRAVFRLRVVDRGRVPHEGACILASNHASNLDHFFIAAPLRRPVQFMAKSQLFVPPLDWIYTHGGVFPVRRGARDEEAFVTARVVLEHGGCVAIYPEAGRSRTGRLADVPKPGVGRLALESGAPVVPVAVHGSAQIREWRRLRFPQITVRFGEPLRLERHEDPSREEQQAAAETIFARVRALHAELERPVPPVDERTRDGRLPGGPGSGAMAPDALSRPPRARRRRPRARPPAGRGA